MKTQRLSLLVISVLLVLVMAACNTPTPSQSPVTPGNPTPVPAQPTSIPPTAPAAPANTALPTSSSACANPYFPTVSGATWNYANTSPMAPASTTARTITDITPTGFATNDATTPDIMVKIKWSCKDGNLTMLDSATVSATGIVLSIQSVNATGFLVPAAISVGSTWSEKLNMVSTGDMNGKQRMTQQNDTQIACTANSKESIQVQAGKFDALKVTCVYNITTTTQIDANPGKPVNSTINITDWYVSGVGSVKTEKTGDIIETHDMTSYSIP